MLSPVNLSSNINIENRSQSEIDDQIARSKLLNEKCECAFCFEKLPNSMWRHNGSKCVELHDGDGFKHEVHIECFLKLSKYNVTTNLPFKCPTCLVLIKDSDAANLARCVLFRYGNPDIHGNYNQDPRDQELQNSIKDKNIVGEDKVKLLLTKINSYVESKNEKK